LVVFPTHNFFPPTPSKEYKEVSPNTFYRSTSAQLLSLPPPTPSFLSASFFSPTPQFPIFPPGAVVPHGPPNSHPAAHPPFTEGSPSLCSAWTELFSPLWYPIPARAELLRLAYDQSRTPERVFPHFLDFSSAKRSLCVPPSNLESKCYPLLFFRVCQSFVLSDFPFVFSNVPNAPFSCFGLRGRLGPSFFVLIRRPSPPSVRRQCCW